MDLKKLKKIINDAIKKEVFSAISIKVTGSKDFSFLTGHLSLDKKNEINEDSLFDLASISKTIVATKFYQLFKQNKFLPMERLSDIYSDFNVPINDDLANRTILELLLHKSGLKSGLPLFNTLSSKLAYYEHIRTKYPKASWLENYLEINDIENLKYKDLKVEYSDLGYILLGEILELHYKTPLLIIIENFINEIGLDSKKLLYSPMENKNLNGKNIVASGQSQIRQNIHGLVNDDNCFTMGGASGHAGLFGTIGELSRFGDLILQTYKNGSKITDAIQFKALIAEKDEQTGYSTAWVYPTDNGQAGTKLSKNSIGSLGFTGTSLWIDLDKEFTISILANRTISKGAITHSSMQDEFKTIRPKIMDIVLNIIK